MFHRTIRKLTFLALLGASTFMLRAADPAPQGTSTAPAPAARRAPVPADQPDVKVGRDGKPDANFLKRHEQYVALARGGGIDLYFEGDSITDGWHWGGKTVWEKEFGPWKPGNFGIGGDRTQHVLWRLQNGELDGVSPKVFVLMIGTNNLGLNTNDQIIAGNAAIIKEFQAKDPNAKILLLGIFPRGEKTDDPLRQRIKDINLGLAKMDDGKNIKYLDIGEKFLQPDGSISKDIMADFLHPTAKGYEIWAAAIKPVLTEWLGAQK